MGVYFLRCWISSFTGMSIHFLRYRVPLIVQPWTNKGLLFAGIVGELKPESEMGHLKICTPIRRRPALCTPATLYSILVWLGIISLPTAYLEICMWSTVDNTACTKISNTNNYNHFLLLFHCIKIQVNIENLVFFGKKL